MEGKGLGEPVGEQDCPSGQRWADEGAGKFRFASLAPSPSPPRAGLVLFHHYMYCRDRISSPSTLLHIVPPMPNVC